MITVLKSKIHRIPVTEGNLNYEGSISISRQLMEWANIKPYEKVQVVNINNGERFETYAIPVEVSKLYIGVNGAGARLVQPGDLLIIMSYQSVESSALSLDYEPTVLLTRGDDIYLGDSSISYIFE